jgi:hypothetical protein
MVRIELSDQEALIMREFLEAGLHALYREIHHTETRSVKEQLKTKQALIERLLGQLTQEPVKP